MKTTTLKVSGMTCGHCTRAVTNALAAVPGVSAVQVSLEKQEASVQGDAVPEKLVAAVVAAGYGAHAADS